MILKPIHILTIPVFFISCFCFSQQCDVIPDPLKGSYEGDCRKNKADGKGTATGEDSYSGDFKNGYPEGKGKYVWKNGDWYDGEWKKGMRDGQGIMHLTTENSKDSVLDGFWKKDKYIGKYESAYIIHYKTADIVRVDIRKEKSMNRNIMFTLESTRGGAMAIAGQIPKPSITSIDVISGQYINQIDQTNLPKTNATILQGIVFPFRARFSIGVQLIEIEFLEEGRYTVDIKINQ